MARTADFTLTTQSLIEEAYDNLQMGVDGESVSPEMFTRAKRTLNLMLSDWQNQGIHLWTYTDATLFLQGGKESYTLESSNFTETFTKTAMTNAAVSGATTVVLDGVTSLAATWFIGIMDANNDLFWTTVDKISGSSVELTDALTSNIAAAQEVFYYEVKAPDVERVLGVRRTNNFTDDTPINFVSRQEYFDLPNKATEGAVSEAHYARQAPNGILYLWQTPADSRELVKLRYERRLYDFVDNDDVPDVPKGYFLAIAMNLAYWLTAKYRVPEAVYNRIEKMSRESLDNALNFDNEVHDISISLQREARN